jgi:hypothetical protein
MARVGATAGCQHEAGAQLRTYPGGRWSSNSIFLVRRSKDFQKHGRQESTGFCPAKRKLVKKPVENGGKENHRVATRGNGVRLKVAMRQREVA